MYKNTNRMNRFRVSVGSSLPLLVLMLLIGNSCGGPKPTFEDWQDTEKSLWITIESVPANAEVYGVVDNEPGIFLGRTLLTVKFWNSYRTKGPVFWQCPNHEAPMEQVLEHKCHMAPVQVSNIPGSDNRQYRWRSTSGSSYNKERAKFHCFIIKEGYKAYFLEDEYKFETRSTDYPNVFKGQKTYNIALER